VASSTKVAAFFEKNKGIIKLGLIDKIQTMNVNSSGKSNLKGCWLIKLGLLLDSLAVESLFMVGGSVDDIESVGVGRDEDGRGGS
jgi:hypothetical protein